MTTRPQVGDKITATLTGTVTASRAGRFLWLDTGTGCFDLGALLEAGAEIEVHEPALVDGMKRRGVSGAGWIYSAADETWTCWRGSHCFIAGETQRADWFDLSITTAE